MSREEFRNKVRYYCRQAGKNQQDLARVLHLHYSTLSAKLNGLDNACLSRPEVLEICKALLQWQAIFSREEAIELVQLAGMKPNQITPDLWPTDTDKEISFQNGYSGQSYQNSPGYFSYSAISKSPAERNINSPERTLPAQLNSFVGRQQEISEIKNLLVADKVRLLTLVGPGGVGKTRLSVQVAEGLTEIFANGIYFVPLASLTNPLLLLPTLSRVLGLKENGPPPLLNTLRSYLANKHLLLILDNFEQLSRASGQVVELLQAAPHLQLMITSRQPLNLYGEYLYQVLPLKLPDFQNPLELQKGPGECEAVRLFVKRACAVKPNFQLDETNRAAIARICARLDGLPLAIELAANQVKAFSPRTILRQIGERAGLFNLLSTNVINQPTRHHSLQNTLDWSYELLTESEQTLFRRLGVLIGGWGEETAKTICWNPGPNHPSSQGERAFEKELASLVGQSLVNQTEDDEGEARYSIFETIREYCLEKLESCGELEEYCLAHLDYYLRLARIAETELKGPRQEIFLLRLDRDHSNLLAALDWAIEQNRLEQALILAGSVGRYWEIRTFFSEGTRLLNLVLEKVLVYQGAPSIDPNILAKALTWLGTLSLRLGNYNSASEKLEEALKLYSSQEPKDKIGLAFTLNSLGILKRHQKDPEASAEFYGESFEMASSLEDLWGMASALGGLGSALIDKNDFEGAVSAIEQSLALFAILKDKANTANLNNYLGEIARCRDNYSQAREYYQNSLDLYRQLGDRLGTAILLHNLGYVEKKLRNSQGAIQYFQQSLSINQDLGRQRGIAACMVGVAGCFVDLGYHLEEAAQLLGAAEATREKLGTTLDGADRVEYRLIVEALKAKLEGESLDRAWEEGCKYSETRLNKGFSSFTV